VVALALFVISHPLGHLIGSWPAVIVSAALVAGGAAAILARAQRGEGEGLQGRLRPE
jgi:hypothetical protein